MENAGLEPAARLLKQIGGAKAEDVKSLAYYLYDACQTKRQDAKEATAYNALIAEWAELSRRAATFPDTDPLDQATLDL